MAQKVDAQKAHGDDVTSRRDGGLLPYQTERQTQRPLAAVLFEHESKEQRRQLEPLDKVFIAAFL